MLCLRRRRGCVGGHRRRPRLVRRFPRLRLPTPSPVGDPPMRTLCAESTSAYCEAKEVHTGDADVPRRISFSASHWRVPAMPWLNRTSLLLFSGSSNHGNMPRCMLNATLNGATYRAIGAPSMSGSAGDRDFRSAGRALVEVGVGSAACRTLLGQRPFHQACDVLLYFIAAV